MPPVIVDTPDPGTLVVVDPLAYLPEQSTTVVIPATVTNVAAGALGPWSNPTDARLTSGNGANITTAGAGNSNYLQCAPAPAGTYAGINDGADITRMIVTYETFVIRTGINYPESALMLMGDGGRYGGGQQGTGAIEGGWQPFSIQMDKSFYWPGGITGAQWKNGTFGPGFQIINSSATEAGTVQIRAVTMQVFFQNPVLAGGTLILCEA